MNKPISLFSKIFLEPIVRLLFIKEMRGKENIPKRNFILVSNHQSHLDWFLCGFVCVPRRFRFIGQVDKYKGFTGLVRDIFYFITETIRLNRKSKESKRKAIKEAITSLKKRYILILYPEGTRSRTGAIAEGKWGTAKFFLETGVPILPMGIEGTFKLFPPGGKLRIERIVKINIGRPLYFQKELSEARILNKDTQEYRNILQRITQETMREIVRLKKEL